MVAHKQNLQIQQQVGFTIMASIGALFTKDGAKQVEKANNDGINTLNDKLTRTLMGIADDDTDIEFAEEDVRGSTRRVPRKRVKHAVKDQLVAFHQNFARLTGQHLPDLNALIEKAGKEQLLRRESLAHGEDVMKKINAEK